MSAQIDLAEVNGRIFVNNSSVGLYPDMVRLREAEQERKGRSKRLAMLSASLTTLRHFRRHRLWISAEGLEAPIHTPLLFVGNNRYEVSLFALGQREALDEGELCLYAIRARSRLGMVWAGIRGVFGRLDQQRDFVTAYVAEAEVSSDRTQPDRLGRRRDGADGDAAALPHPPEGAEAHRSGTAECRPGLGRDEAIRGDARGREAARRDRAADRLSLRR